MTYKDITGEKYGRLKAIERIGKGKNGRSLWKCECDCGNIKIADISLLRNGHITSCGCYKLECNIKNATKHGHRNARIYTIWCRMKDRCDNSNSKIYKWYGEKGITYCDEWSDFKQFYDWAMSHGYSENLTLKRKDVNGNYCPENCCWIPLADQANNRTSNRFITYKGETKTLAQWCKQYGFKWEQVRDRIDKLGWDFERAITTPINTKFRRRKK